MFSLQITDKLDSTFDKYQDVLFRWIGTSDFELLDLFFRPKERN